MSKREEEKGQVEEAATAASREAEAGDSCAHIEDPVRRG